MRFQPQTENEKQARDLLLAAWKAEGSDLLFRENSAHITVSAFVMNFEMDKTLMVYHNLMQTYTWPGGHADGDMDLAAVALREVQEETGIPDAFLVSSDILSVSVFAVPSHTKHGAQVPAHIHYSVCYGFLSTERQAPRVKPDENSDVSWLPVDALADYCDEPEMLPVYARIVRQMRTLKSEKEALYGKLPDALLPWYSENARDLPWRRNKEPYHVWLSEIMLQQTRVEAVKSYYKRFLSELPDIQALAEVSEERLLKLWEGLGYYNRARNLQKAAKKILIEYNGKMPSDYAAIAELPGIGAYTAGAIASICFDQPVAAVDGNVLRVIARITELFAPVDKSWVKESVATSLKDVYPMGNCGNFTQSLMELGATVCLPVGMPRCPVCPAKEFCLAHRSGTTGLLPVREQKKPRRVEQKTVFVLECDGCIAIEKRGSSGLLAGLWQLPNVADIQTAEAALQIVAEWGAAPVDLEKRLNRQHVFTHVQWDMACYYIRCRERCQCFIWADREALWGKYSLPTAFRMFL